MRLHNWPTHLANFLAQRQHQPFEWGKNDCCLFAADSTLAITGVDPAATFRGKYTTAIGAKRALIRYGQGDIKSTFSAVFGAPQGILHARRGDIVLVNINNQDLVGVIFGEIYVVTPNGLSNVPLSAASACWSVD